MHACRQVSWLAKQRRHTRPVRAERRALPTQAGSEHGIGVRTWLHSCGYSSRFSRSGLRTSSTGARTVRDSLFIAAHKRQTCNEAMHTKTIFMCIHRNVRGSIGECPSLHRIRTDA